MAVGYQLVQIGADGEPEFDEDGNPIPVGDVVTLGVGRWGRDIAIERAGIVLETERGRRYVYRQFQRRTFRLPFALLPVQLAVFAALDEAVDGDGDPFLFIPDVDEASPGAAIFVRKTAGFVEGTEEPVTVNGAVVRRVIYVLELSEEPTGTEITA